jgi:hypothetical protein
VRPVTLSFPPLSFLPLTSVPFPFSPHSNHGYDPALPSMRGIFVAHGPFAQHLRSLPSSSLARRSSNAYALSGRAPIEEDPATMVIPGFANLEVYDLVARLLGIEEEGRAKTNGTRGFWERYLDEDVDGGEA